MKDGTRCRDRATDVDHIIPAHRGGTDNPANLTAICDWHHRRKTSREANARHVTCDPGQHEVTRRATTGRPAWVLQLIADWYQ